MLDVLRHLRGENPPALRLDGPPDEQRQVIRLIDGRLEADGFRRGDVRRTVDDETERAFRRVLAQQHDRLGKVRVDELRHRKQQCRCERHDRILPECKVCTIGQIDVQACGCAQPLADFF